MFTKSKPPSLPRFITPKPLFKDTASIFTLAGTSALESVRGFSPGTC